MDRIVHVLKFRPYMYPMPKTRARAAGSYGAQLAAARSGNAAGPTNAVPKHTNAPCDTCISYR